MANQTTAAAGTESETPIRAGVYITVADAKRAVTGLLAAGFTKDEITVMCANEKKEAQFQEFEHQEPAGKHAGDASLAGAVIGAGLGALTVLTGVIATGGLGLLAAGAIAAAGGSAGGTFVGAMLTRGVEKELADFYDQELTGGNILVAVEVHGPDAQVRLATASCVLDEAGAKPISLQKS